MMAMDSVDVEREMEGLFGDTDQTQQENATQSLTQEEAEQREGGANLDVTGAEETKKKRVMRPQPKLDPDRIMGPRGLLAIEDMFKDWEPRGKGREFDDLEVVMKKMEHWAHRLFPSLPFDQVLEKIAGPLGKKKTVQCHVKKIRLGMVEPVREEVNAEEEKDDEDVERYDGGGGDDDRDEFDEMLRLAGGQMAPPVMPVPPRPTGGLTEEQKEKIRRNRELAEKKRKERLAAAAAADLVQSKPLDEGIEHEEVSEAVEKVSLDNDGEGREQRENHMGGERNVEPEKEKNTNKNDEVLNLDEMMEEMVADESFEGNVVMEGSACVEPEKEKSANKEAVNVGAVDKENESNLVIGSLVEPAVDKTNSKDTNDEVVEEMDAVETNDTVNPKKEKTTCDEVLNLDEMMEEMDAE